MNEQTLSNLLPVLLGAAWLLPLASFAVVVLVGPRLGKAGLLAGHVATGAILGSAVLSLLALGAWLYVFGFTSGQAAHHGGAAGEHVQQEAEHNAAAHGRADASHGEGGDAIADADAPEAAVPAVAADGSTLSEPVRAGKRRARPAPMVSLPPPVKHAFTDDWYTLAEFGSLRVTISYYIDALTVVMFVMVSVIATCIHFYSIGYMHEELHDVTDHEVTLADGSHLHRRGRFHRFFQYLSLFCFSMLGLVVAGNIFMVFVFWELVGICSYFLIGFYIERRSATNAANKAFIVNRVGDFGFIIGLMALWSSLGTFAFGDVPGQGPGIFSQVRNPQGEPPHALAAPTGMVLASAQERVAEIVRDHFNVPDVDPQSAWSEAVARSGGWRAEGLGYGLLVLAGLGIFCGCVGKSAQFPLHVWLPDAMEGPTPVSALVHSATMVAAGVYLGARFFPVFTPEVLLVIAYVGAITLLLAATIAITAVDIKRVLAYSTVSQLGYMMLSLGVGGWLAGVFHLITHAFFKSLLFLGSGSVIHACHTNDMTRMGGLRRKMPWTAYTMLVGCLAIIGAGIPFLIGLSGYYSKDAILAQVLSFRGVNVFHGNILFAVAAGGAALTAFYMFRLWYLTFAGEPRDEHIYEHVHESPQIMYVPLVVLAVAAVAAGWPILGLTDLLEQARPLGDVGRGVMWASLTYPHEHASHAASIHVPATLAAAATALAGFLLATLFYGLRWLNPNEVRQQFPAVYRWLWNKWYFDELYDLVFVRPVHFVAALAARFDRRWIDGLIDSLARWVRGVSVLDDVLDRYLVDGAVNLTADWFWSLGRGLRHVQTGRLRQYVMLIVVGAVALTFLLEAFVSLP